MLRKIFRRLLPALSELLPLLAKHRRRLAVGFVWLLLSNVFAVLIPWVLKRGVDSLKTHPEPRVVLGHAGVLVLLAAVSGLFLYLQRMALIGASREMEFELRNRFFLHLESLSQDLFLRYPTGDLMARASNDLTAVRYVLGPAIMYFMNAIVSVLMALVFMLRIDPVLTLATLLPFPVLAFATQRFARTLHRRSHAVQEQFGTMSNMLQEDFSGIRVVKSHAIERLQEEHFEKLNREYMRRNLGLIRARAVFYATMGFLVGGGLLILLWLGGLRVMTGHTSLGGFVAFNGYLALLTWPFIALGWVLGMVQRGEASMRRVQEILDLVPTIRSPAHGHRPERVRGEIRLERVTLLYPGSRVPALREVSVEIPAGATVGIVGRTGSGKSSLARLLVRLYDPTEGRILLDGVDVRDWNLEALRDAVTVVLQESFLWSDTLERNVLFGRPEASREELERAAAWARLDKDFPQFPDGWSTRVGERGLTLSGGQRQRTALARALLRGSPVLVLDDTLSSLDTETQGEILEHLLRQKGRRTLILISHRISTVREADKILVLDRGRLVEEGHHKELLRRGGLYARLARRQALLQAVEAEEAEEVSG
jgi:ATP-binding cassette subfamily B protein